MTQSSPLSLPKYHRHNTTKLYTGLISVLLTACVPSLAADIPQDRARAIEEAAPTTAQATPQKPRRVLIFLTPPHLMPKDPHKGYCIPYGAYALKTLGTKTKAYEPVVSDDLTMILPEQIDQFDAIVLNNTSNAWITPTPEQVASDEFRKVGSDAQTIESALRDSLLKFVRGGKGLMAIHYAIGANRQWPEFANLLGAAFNGHPWNEEVGIRVEDPDHPLVAGFGGQDFRLTEETFQFKAPYSRDRLRVLLSLDTEKTNMTVPWIHRDDNDFALAWVRSEGKGRVFYSAIGHRTEHYWNPAILRFYLGGVQFCTGDLLASTEPISVPSASKDSIPDGFTSLFNGRDLSDWKGDKTIWSVQDGAITGQTTSATQLQTNNFLIWEGGQPKDFELRLQFKLIGGNSGIYFHAEPRTDGDPLVGPQADFSADHRWTGVLMEWKKRDVLAERGQRVEIGADGQKQVVGSVGEPQQLLKLVRNEQWNDYTLITRGERTVLKINGTTMCEVTDHDPQRTPLGYLALQVHKGPPMQVQFRQIMLKDLSSAEK